MDLQSRGQADADCLFLANVLDKLYDFGEWKASQRFTSQRKRKRRRGDEPVREEPSDCRADVRADPRRHMKSEQAGLKITSNIGSINNSQNQVEVVVFQDPRKKRKAKESPAPRTVSVTEETQSEQIEELNLEKARLEVHRFGITGFKKEQQRVFEQDRAVMLGARPPQREYVNYKTLQQQKKKAKADEQPDPKKKKKQKTEKKTSTSGLGAAPTGQMGRFKNGMLILSSSEIQKLKGRK
uniref:Zgc:194224 n=1 Tax=Takifugu rubripes TaxID=31033 RepID=A0A674P9E2_TAKRU